jgi:hypothetical protein
MKIVFYPIQLLLGFMRRFGTAVALVHRSQKCFLVSQLPQPISVLEGGSEFVSLGQGIHNFFQKCRSPLGNSRPQKGHMKKVTYLGPTNIRC